jgi:hypothetical protein
MERAKRSSKPDRLPSAPRCVAPELVRRFSLGVPESAIYHGSGRVHHRRERHAGVPVTRDVAGSRP